MRKKASDDVPPWLTSSFFILTSFQIFLFLKQSERERERKEKEPIRRNCKNFRTGSYESGLVFLLVRLGWSLVLFLIDIAEGIGGENYKSEYFPQG